MRITLAAIALLAAFARNATAATIEGRIIGKIEVGGVDANLEQLREGSAWVYTQCLRELPVEDRRLYLEAQRLAKAKRRGLWLDDQPEPPWQRRRGQRSHMPHGG